MNDLDGLDGQARWILQREEKIRRLTRFNFSAYGFHINTELVIRGFER